MRPSLRAGSVILWLLLPGCVVSAAGQASAVNEPVLLTVVDETGAPVADAQVLLQEPGRAEMRLLANYAGEATYALQGTGPYRLRIAKPGFYETVLDQADPLLRDLRLVLNHEQMVLEQVNVTASVPDIDTEQTSDQRTMNLPEIVNVPYATSRDIRNLLPFYPGVVPDASGQVHVAGSETWATLDTLDGFDIRSPISGILALRVSADAVRSIDEEMTRYPVEFGRSTGGVVAFYTGMGDNRFRFNTTDFLPSFQSINGIRFDKVVPRLTFSGPLKRDRAWFFDGLEAEYDDTYIRELPKGADTNHLLRGSNLARFQVNARPANILSGGVLFNDYHSPFDGLSPLVPQQSTTRRSTIAWLPYLRDQQSFQNGALLDIGFGVVRFRDGYEPYGDSPFQITPELFLGSYFENLASRSQRVEGNAALYLPPRHGAGLHNLKAGIDVDHIGYDETVTRAPVNYLREDGTLLRQSVFPRTAPFNRHNVEAGAYVQDRWTPRTGLLIESGLRYDWDEIVRRPLFSPRLAAIYSPPGAGGRTALSAGIGLYYEHTQLEYLARALAGVRDDTYFAADGVTLEGPPLETTFSANAGSLHEARALNWSVGVEQKLPGSVYVRANFLRKTVSDALSYANRSSPEALAGNYVLTNSRQDHDHLAEIDARRTFAGGYALFAAYTHSTAHTNAAIDYVPTLSQLGPQQGGPLAWDTPNRVLSWGWTPLLAPCFKKSWDFVYSFDWHSGFPFTSANAGYQVAGAAGSKRIPDYFSISPGVEWRFHFRGSHFGLRGIIENATDRRNPRVVNDIVDSPRYGTFSGFEGKALTARIRLIGAKK